MSHLEDLRKSLSDMSQEERMELIRAARADRRISKHAVTERKAKQQRKEEKIEKDFLAMSPEDREAFLKMLGEQDEG